MSPSVSSDNVTSFLSGYVMKFRYNRETEEVVINTLSLLAMKKEHRFHISAAGPPSKAIAFSTFQAEGKSFFMHTEIFQDRELLSKLLGAYITFEDIWDKEKK